MSALKQLTLVALTVSTLCFLAAPVRADIYRWDNDQLIPGTEGIEPGPGIDLSGWNTDSHNLRYGDFSVDLSNSNFSNSWLDNAHFRTPDFSGRANLTNANLSGANLAGANLEFSTLTNANFTGADTRSAHWDGGAGAILKN